ncbi:MAG: DUF2254 domain-containing protein [Mesorhizobium sp.]|nr:DUF2254 domain-containing protein [Mesorhizobium sp.]
MRKSSLTRAKPKQASTFQAFGRQQLRVAWDSLRTSLWLVPGVMGFMALGLVLAGFAADERLSQRPSEDVPFFIYVSMPAAAREMLSTLFASMITMTSLVFSITMVVLTLAASQFGPRLIRNFMALPHTQLALGTFIMTTVYCLLSLGLVGSQTSEEPQAYASISLAILLALVSIGVLVMFLHSLARSIVSETVIKRVGHEVDEILSRFGDAVPEEPVLPADFDKRALFFGPHEDGYIQGLEIDTLVREACRADVLIGLSFRPGRYVAKGGGGIGVYPASQCDDALQAQIQKAIIVGPNRMPDQDPEFAIRHLVEIAVRALSPGINDPYTAAAVVDQLSASLSRLVEKALPPSVIRGEKGRVRLIAPQPDYASLIGAAFNQIRQNGSNKPMVVIHLIDAIIRISEHIWLDTQREALREQLDALEEDAHRDIAGAFDKSAIDMRAKSARKALKRPLPKAAHAARPDSLQRH